MVKRCGYECNELLHARSVVVVLSRGSINNEKLAHRQVLQLRRDSDFEPYFYEMRTVDGDARAELCGRWGSSSP